MDLAEDDPQGRSRLDAIKTELVRLGWTDGTNALLEVRWGAGVAERMRAMALELVTRKREAILAYGSAAVAALRQVTTTVPIVFVSVVDPVGAGFVANLARPGGNVTGFMLLEFDIGAKWLEILKDVDPRIERVGVLRDASLASGRGQFAAVQSAAPAAGVNVVALDLRDARELESDIDAFAASGKAGLIVTAGALTTVYRDQIVSLAAKHRLPSVYSNRLYVTSGGLLSSSPDRFEQFQQAASYIDRILKGEKPANLPVQAPTKYELVINRQTARTLGLEIPPSLMVRADEVIE